MNGPAPARRISPWGAVVAVSALLVVGAAAALLIATIASSHERADRFAFGHDAVATRSVTMGELRLRSRCPKAVPHTCSSRYRLVVPDNVPVDVRATGDGTVRLRGYRGSARLTTRDGDIDVAGFCGFSLQARAEGGDIATSAACAPQQLVLRSTAGSVRALVPPGRYQVEAESTNGAERVSGVSAV